MDDNEMHVTAVKDNEKRKGVSGNGWIGLLIIVISMALLYSLVILIDHHGEISDLVFMILWSILCCYLLYCDTEFIFKYLYVFFFFSTNILGVFIVENTSIWLKELQVDSLRAGSLALLILVHSVFVCAVYIYDKQLSRKINYRFKNNRGEFALYRKDAKIIMILLAIISAVAILFFWIHVSPHPALLLKIDRFDYQKLYITGVFDRIHSLAIYIPIMSAVLYSNKKTRLAVVLLLFYIFVELWIGSKFTAFFLAVCVMVPALLVEKDDRKTYRKLFVGSVAVIIGLLMIVLVFNTVTYGNKTEENVAYFQQRTAQQGQLWWAIYKNESPDILHLDELSDEYRIWFVGNSPKKREYRHGIYKIMRLTTPETLFKKKVESGSRYAGSTAASLYYYFKFPLMLIPMLILGLLLAFVTSMYWGALKQHKILSSILYGRLISSSFSVISQSDFDVIFSYRRALVFVIAVCIGLIIDYTQINGIFHEKQLVEFKQ